MAHTKIKFFDYLPTVSLRGDEATLQMNVGPLRDGNNFVFQCLLDSNIGTMQFRDGSEAEAMAIEVSPNVAKKFAQEIIRMADKKLNEMNVGTVTVNGGLR